MTGRSKKPLTHNLLDFVFGTRACERSGRPFPAKQRYRCAFCIEFWLFFSIIVSKGAKEVPIIADGIPVQKKTLCNIWQLTPKRVSTFADLFVLYQQHLAMSTDSFSALGGPPGSRCWLWTYSCCGVWRKCLWPESKIYIRKNQKVDLLKTKSGPSWQACWMSKWGGNFCELNIAWPNNDKQK